MRNRTKYKHLCLNCNKHFLSLNMHQTFCSLFCNYQHKRNSNLVNCLHCSNLFEKKNKSNKYCCRECYFKSAAKNETYLETQLYAFLDNKGIQYEKQKQILNCIPDAYIESIKLCVFADGSYWHSKPEVKKRDRRISRRLCNKGYKVLRVPETYERTLDIVKLERGFNYHAR